MKHVARALLLATVLLVAGCSLFRDSDVQVAEITSMSVPDPVRAWTTFNVTVHAFFAVDMGRVFDRVEVTYTDASMGVRVWSRPGDGGVDVPQLISERFLTFRGGPAEPGEFRVIVHQPDGRETVKTVAVLP